MITLTLDLPNVAPGGEVEVEGLGIFKNAEVTVLPDDVVETYERQTGKSFEDQFGNDLRFKFDFDAASEKSVTDVKAKPAEADVKPKPKVKVDKSEEGEN